jgi:hypothetical protein
MSRLRDEQDGEATSPPSFDLFQSMCRSVGVVHPASQAYLFGDQDTWVQTSCWAGIASAA